MRLLRSSDCMHLCLYLMWFFFIISKACKIFKINSMRSMRSYIFIELPFWAKKKCILFFYDMELDKIIPVDSLWCHNIVWFLAYCPRKQQYQSFIQLDICNWRAFTITYPHFHSMQISNDAHIFQNLNNFNWKEVYIRKLLIALNNNNWNYLHR